MKALVAHDRTDRRRYGGDADGTALRLRRNGYFRRCGGELGRGGECHADQGDYTAA
jgi:hypothetical protein